MPLPRPSQEQPRRAVTASAARVGDRDSEFRKRVSMTWQRRTLAYIDMIPELSYASNFYARMLKQVRIYPGRLQPDQKIVPITDGLPVELLNRIQDPGGGRSQLQGNYGRLMFTTGEGLLFGRKLRTTKERWSFVWNDEVNVETNSADNSVLKIIHHPEGPNGREVVYGPEEAIVYRFWTPHPRLSGEPISPMRASLDIAEELIILTLSVRSTAVTRMTRGLLKVPQELSQGSIEPLGDEDPEANSFLAEMIDHLTAQVEQAGSAAASAPWVVEGAHEYLDRLEWVSTHDPQTDYMEQGLRKEAIERLARGLDMPVEVMLGLGQSNHWAAKQILDDMWQSHGTSVAEQWVDDLGEVYLRPALEEADYEGWEDVVVAYDDPAFVIRSDRAEVAFKAHAAQVISDEALRRDTGYTEADAPGEEEMARRQGTPPGEMVEDEPDPSEGPPPPGPEGDSGRRTRVVGSSVERELGAAQMALHRCRELAGIRIRQKEKTCPECLQAAKNGVTNALVASAVGIDNIQRMRLDPLTLVAGGADSLRTLLEDWGYGAQAPALAQMLEVYASRTLLQDSQPPLPSGFAAHLARAKEASSAVAQGEA